MGAELHINDVKKIENPQQGVNVIAEEDGVWAKFDVSKLARKDELPVVPEALPNPGKLTFKGAVTAEYDGSGEVTVTIPQPTDPKPQQWDTV